MSDLEQILQVLNFIKQLLEDFTGEPNTPETQAAIELRVQRFISGPTKVIEH